MIMALLCLTSFMTIAALVWALMGTQNHSLRGRFLRYAGESTLAVDTGPHHQPLRLPRPWEAFLARAGLEWQASQSAIMVLLHAAVGALLGGVIDLVVPGAVAGIAALYLRLRVAQSRRIHLMAEQLPDALMLMATALKSGLGFQQALQLVAQEGPLPLAPELGRLGSDLALGSSMEEGLLRLQTRLGSTDGEMLAAALLVQRQTGGNLVELLLNLHDTIRDRQLVQGQVRTLTAQGRLSGMVLTAIPVFIALSFYTLNREYLMMLVIDPRGQMMSAIALFLLVCGVASIRQIVRITL